LKKFQARQAQSGCCHERAKWIMLIKMANLSEIGAPDSHLSSLLLDVSKALGTWNISSSRSGWLSKSLKLESIAHEQRGVMGQGWFLKDNLG